MILPIFWFTSVVIAAMSFAELLLKSGWNAVDSRCAAFLEKLQTPGWSLRDYMEPEVAWRSGCDHRELAQYRVWMIGFLFDQFMK